MPVEVTAQDIDAGGCPITRAIHRETGNDAYIIDGNYYCCIPSIYGCRQKLPPVAIAFLERFACGEPVQPFCFNLAI